MSNGDSSPADNAARGAPQKSGSRSVAMKTQDLFLTIQVEDHLPESRHGSVIVRYRPHSPYIFAARKCGAGVLIETGIKFTSDRVPAVMARAALAALEILEGCTSAVAVRSDDEIRLLDGRPS